MNLCYYKYYMEGRPVYLYYTKVYNFLTWFFIQNICNMKVSNAGSVECFELSYQINWQFHTIYAISACAKITLLCKFSRKWQEHLHKNEGQMPLVIVIISHNLMSSINVQLFQWCQTLISWKSSYQHYFMVYQMFKLMIWIIYQSANMWWWVKLLCVTINYRL